MYFRMSEGALCKQISCQQTVYESLRFDMYKDLIIIHLQFMQPKFNLIDVKQTTLDKFANFGGNFGIFAEITGVSFLGILNFFILFAKIIFSRQKLF